MQFRVLRDWGEQSEIGDDAVDGDGDPGAELAVVDEGLQ